LSLQAQGGKALSPAVGVVISVSSAEIIGCPKIDDGAHSVSLDPGCEAAASGEGEAQIAAPILDPVLQDHETGPAITKTESARERIPHVDREDAASRRLLLRWSS
jgi:hypothetical protein